MLNYFQVKGIFCQDDDANTKLQKCLWYMPEVLSNDDDKCDGDENDYHRHRTQGGHRGACILYFSPVVRMFSIVEIALLF